MPPLFARRSSPPRGKQRPYDGRIEGVKGIKGVAISAQRRHRKIMRDTIYGVTKGDIRRLARRGGVKRMSGVIYDDIRLVMKDHLRNILQDVCAIVDHGNRKTVTVPDVIFALKRIGRPIYGFGIASRGNVE